MKLRIAPVYTAPPGETAPIGVFAGALLVPGVRQILDFGGDIMIVVDREHVRIDPATAALSPAGGPLPTDGAA